VTEQKEVRSRREEYAEATHEALLDSAALCFYEHGFAATSLDEIAQRARLTKGAIYHHFHSKRELFLAVLERHQENSAGLIAQAGATGDDAWTGIVNSFNTFLDLISNPVYQRICWVEGPAALGFEEWWACGERFEIEVIHGVLNRAAESGILRETDLDMLSQVLFGAVVAGVLAMVRSEEPEVERERFRTVMIDVMLGMVNFGPPT
jgi:AcrR family transcriptional regulator